MKWIKDHKALSYLCILLTLLGSAGFFIFRNSSNFLVSRDEAIHKALTACWDPVNDDALVIQTHVDLYKNAPPEHLVIMKPRNKLWPVWIVTIDGHWNLTGGPGPEPVTITTYERCTAVIDAMTGDVIVADPPPPIQ